MTTMYRGLIIPSGTDPPNGPQAFRDYTDSGPIPRFADAAARDAAIPNPVEGAIVYLVDLSSYTHWDGTQWVALASAAQSSTPVGSMLMFAGATAPAGWLLCQGQSLDSVAYPELFAVIGNTYGGTAPNFLLPDFRGRSPMGVGSMGGANTYTLGQKYGEEAHVLSLHEMANHAHGSATTPAGAPHSHQGWNLEQFVTSGPVTGFGGIFTGATQNVRPTTHSTTDHQHGVYAEGGNGAHQTVHPILATNVVIKV